MLLHVAFVEEQQMGVEMLVVQLQDHDDLMVVELEHEDQEVEQTEVETRQNVLDHGSNSNLIGMEQQIDNHLEYMEYYSIDVYD
ncbi:hypothetical protein [Neobacillus cucumis]|uniref:hypothetical protein n=1 Tax=Neobacillus cucumis TaxID=1740721 RepID=UPI0015E07ED7|nr:hypothetical protein [Neobacillus cucumis]